MGHVVRDVELHFLSHGRNGVAPTSLGAELRRNEVRTILSFWALLSKAYRRGARILTFAPGG